MRGTACRSPPANGTVDAARQVKMQNPHMMKDTNPFVMPDSPALLSVGKRCMLEGYSFIWKAGKTPLLVRPDGLVVDLAVDRFIPYIDNDCSIRLPQRSDSATFIIRPVVPVVESEAPTVPFGAGEGVHEAIVEVPPAVPLPPPPAEEHPDQDVRSEDGSQEEEAYIPAHRTKAEARSLEHIMSHRIKNPWCEACVRAKMHNRPARVKRWDEEARPVKFGEIFTADHFITTKVTDMCMHGSQYGLVVYDRGTEWISAYGVKHKDTVDATEALQHFAGPRDDTKLFYRQFQRAPGRCHRIRMDSWY